MTLTFLALSFNSFAATSREGTVIVVPYPTQQQAFYGRIATVEKDVKAQLMQKAVAVCGTKENISTVADVEVKISFMAIEEDNAIFVGGYPLASASAVVYCYQ